MMGVVEPMIQGGQKVDTVNLYMGGQPRAKVTFADLKSPFPQPLMLEQSATERILIEALEKRGVTVERQMELTGFEQGDQGVRAQVRGPDGKQETTKVSYLVGCDGAHSLVRHTLELPFPGTPYPEDFLLGDVLLEWDLPHSELFIFIKEDGVRNPKIRHTKL